MNCDFPDEIDSLKEILVKVNLSFKLKKFFVEEFNSARHQLTSQMADHSNLIKSLIVRAEDSRIMDDL